MINVYTDASVSRKKEGAAGVIFNFPNGSRLVLSFPTESGLTSNIAEMTAIYMAGRFLLDNWESLDYDPKSNFVRINTDSENVVNGFMRPERRINDRAFSIAKKTRQLWDKLRDVGAIRGWECVKINRSTNPADKVAKNARKEFGGLYQCPRSPKPNDSSGRSP